jgi:hypothetical protein
VVASGGTRPWLSEGERYMVAGLQGHDPLHLSQAVNSRSKIGTVHMAEAEHCFKIDE